MNIFARFLTLSLIIFCLAPVAAFANDSTSQLSPTDQVQADMADDGQVNSTGTDVSAAAEDSPSVDQYNTGCEATQSCVTPKPPAKTHTPKKTSTHHLPRTGADISPLLLVGIALLLLGGFAWEISNRNKQNPEKPE